MTNGEVQFRHHNLAHICSRIAKLAIWKKKTCWDRLPCRLEKSLGSSRSRSTTSFLFSWFFSILPLFGIICFLVFFFTAPLLFSSILAGFLETLLSLPLEFWFSATGGIISLFPVEKLSKQTECQFCPQNWKSQYISIYCQKCKGLIFRWFFRKSLWFLLRHVQNFK